MHAVATQHKAEPRMLRSKSRKFGGLPAPSKLSRWIARKI